MCMHDVNPLCEQAGSVSVFRRSNGTFAVHHNSASVGIVSLCFNLSDSMCLYVSVSLIVSVFVCVWVCVYVRNCACIYFYAFVCVYTHVLHRIGYKHVNWIKHIQRILD